MESPTGTTLFVLLDNPSDQQAWRRFVDRYGPLIYAWCRRRGLQDADAEDATQEVLRRLQTGLSTFDREKGRFRAWLYRVTGNACKDLVNLLKRPGYTGSGDSNVLAQLGNVEASNDLAEHIEKEHQRERLEVAMARTQLRVSPRDWKIFHALALEKRSAEDVAAEHGLRVGSVYAVRSQVKEVLNDEIQRLNELFPE